MRVVHILKDGTILTDITGHVVRAEDAGPLYQLIDRINQKGPKKNVHKNEVAV